MMNDRMIETTVSVSQRYEFTASVFSEGSPGGVESIATSGAP